MAWKNIYGQNRIKEILQRAFIENKIAGAYLFVGDDGTGKEASAFEFAKLLNCPDPQTTESTAEVSDNFDSKYSNNLFNHKNIHYITPLPSGKSSKKEATSINSLSDDQIKEVQYQLNQKANNYYHKVQISDANQIKIDQIRELKKQLKYSQSMAGRTVVIIRDAHLLTNEASNAFLKTIEEPHQNTTIILCTNNLEQILQTIRSRCQTIKFPPLSDDDLKSYLQDQNHSLDGIEMILPFARGSVTRIQDYLSEDMNQLRDDVIELLRNGLRKNNYRLKTVNSIDQIVSQKDKNYTKSIIYLIMFWFNDALKISCGFDRVVNSNQKSSIEKFVENFPNANYSEIINTINVSIGEIDKNINQHLVLLTLFANLRKLIN